MGVVRSGSGEGWEWGGHALTTVGDLVLPGVHGPGLVPERELLGEPDAETNKVSGAGHLATQVHQQRHLLNGED